MKRFTVVVAPAILLAFLALFFLRTVSTHAASAGAACSGWKYVKSPNAALAHNDYLYAVAATATNDVWAVGYYESNMRIGHHVYANLSLIEHWDGNSWSIVPSPNASTSDNRLFGVAALASNDAWAVGLTTGSGSNFQTLTEHWNGTQWSIVPSANPGTIDNILRGVTIVSAKNVWAVGYSNGAGQTLVEHWNGTQWSAVASPNPGSFYNDLNSITATSATNIWAVGDSFNTNSTFQTLVEHWNGTQWSVVTSPSPGTANNFLWGVSAASAKNTWAVGYYFNTNGPDLTLIERWNGTSWRVDSSANPGSSDILYGVAATSAKSVWAVGYNVASNAQGLVEHWDGTRWNVVTVPQPNADQYFMGVSVAPGAPSVYAVGSAYKTISSKQTTFTEIRC